MVFFFGWSRRVPRMDTVEVAYTHTHTENNNCGNQQLFGVEPFRMNCNKAVSKITEDELSGAIVFLLLLLGTHNTRTLSCFVFYTHYSKYRQVFRIYFSSNLNYFSNSIQFVRTHH